jgi:hypothetical protein
MTAFGYPAAASLSGLPAVPYSPISPAGDGWEGERENMLTV